MQYFFNRLNYYSRFIEDYAIYAAVLYELQEAEYYTISRIDRVSTVDTAKEDGNIRA